MRFYKNWQKRKWYSLYANQQSRARSASHILERSNKIIMELDSDQPLFAENIENIKYYPNREGNQTPQISLRQLWGGGKLQKSLDPRAPVETKDDKPQ